MTKEQTLAIIKPDAVGKNHIGAIISRCEKNGLQVVAGKMLHMTEQQAKDFYAVHKDRPFYSDLVDFIISGPVFVMALEGDNAISKYRDVIGATNPQEAAPGTVRADFATTIEENAVHGSDSAETAKQEISFFFSNGESVCPRTR